MNNKEPFDCIRELCKIDREGDTITVKCLSCKATSEHDEAAETEAQRAADRLAVSRVILGLAFVAVALAGLAAWHREPSGLFALSLVGMLMAVLSICIRRRWIA